MSEEQSIDTMTPFRKLVQSFTFCLVFVVSAVSQADGDDWPQWRGPSRDGRWLEQGVVEKFTSPQLELKWRAEIGAGYSSPTVADGRVYVTDRVAEPEQVERVHCFDWTNGKLLWSHSYPCPYRKVGYPDGPRVAVHVHDGRAYTLGTMGHLFCFDAAEGKVLWQQDLGQEYEIQMPGWGIAAAPVVEGGQLIVPVSGKNACVVAFDLETGQERWKALDDRGNYSSPIVIEQAGKRVLVYWSADRVVGLDPTSGTLHWEHPFPAVRMPMGVATPVLHEGKLFFTGFFDGCLLLELDSEKMAVKELWRRKGPSESRTDGLHCTISTPVILGEHIYGVDSYGELRCLALEDGARVWESLEAVPSARWSTIHFVQNGERTWMFNERGELIIATLSPAGYQEHSRAKLIEPTQGQLKRRGGVCWSHPAFAYKHVFARNDRELVCADLGVRSGVEK